jgi:hypothetical protein
MKTKKQKWTPDPMRELDAWIAQNVFGLPVDFEAGRREFGPGYLWFIAGVNGAKNQCDTVKHYSTDPSAAMEVLKKCAIKCESTIEIISSIHSPPSFSMRGQDGEWTDGKTLELSIALLAKKLFTTP